MILLVAIIFCSTVSAFASEPLPRPPLQASDAKVSAAAMMRAMHEHLVFPMEIIRHQQELDLSPEQKAYIKKRIQEAESELAGLNWDLQEAVAKIRSVLKQNTVDEKKALTLLEQILELENSVKKNRFLLMVRIKNKLTAKQMDKLRQIKANRNSSRLRPHFKDPEIQPRQPAGAGKSPSEGNPGKKEDFTPKSLQEQN